MDNVTHIALGGVLAYACFGKKIGRFAWLAGGIAATIPDLDVFIKTGDVIVDRLMHRHFSHSLLVIPVIALVAAAVLMFFQRARDNYKTVFLAATVGVATHGLLDAFTSYGTLLFWPFNYTRVAWDTIAVIDPIFTLIVLVGLIVATRKRSEKVARVAVALAVAYLGLGFVQHERAAAAQRTLAESRGHIMERSRVTPQLGSILVWRGMYEFEGKLYADGIRTPFLGSTVARPSSGPVQRLAVEDLRPLPVDDRTELAFERFAWFTDGWIARSPGRPEVIGDMRYSSELEGFEPLWGLALENTIKPRWTSNTDRIRGDGIARLWKQMVSNEGFEPLPRTRPNAGEATAAPQ